MLETWPLSHSKKRYRQVGFGNSLRLTAISCLGHYPRFNVRNARFLNAKRQIHRHFPKPVSCRTSSFRIFDEFHLIFRRPPFASPISEVILGAGWNTQSLRRTPALYPANYSSVLATARSSTKRLRRGMSYVGTWFKKRCWRLIGEFAQFFRGATRANCWLGCDRFLVSNCSVHAVGERTSMPKAGLCDCEVCDGPSHKEPRRSMARLSNDRGPIECRPAQPSHFTPRIGGGTFRSLANSNDLRAT